ncbi:hypothetical protein TWF718_010471 [Orbilia javanica]|uniref:Uncharacterized protein n=1 Tax=Orbilia javanica TaxID=47235 RepID=A0AAN8MQY6_9PEZI
MADRTSSSESPKKKYGPRDAIKGVFTSFFKLGRSRSKPQGAMSNQPSPTIVPDVPPVRAAIEPWKLQPVNKKPSSIPAPDTEGFPNTDGDMTAEIIVAALENLPLPRPYTPIIRDPDAPFTEDTQTIATPGTFADYLALPDELRAKSSLMTLAGINRPSDIIYPPFNIWRDLVKATINLGVPPQILSPEALYAYANMTDREAKWYEPPAIEMMRVEISAYKAAIRYVYAASSYLTRSHKKDRKIMLGLDFYGVDFRLAGVEKYIENLIRDVKICCEGCGNGPVERAIALSAGALEDICLDLQNTVSRLRQTIHAQIVRKVLEVNNKTTVLVE